MLVDPAPCGDVRLGIAQRHAVPNDLTSGRDVRQGNFVGLRDGVQGGKAGEGLLSGGDVPYCNRYVVHLFDTDHCHHEKFLLFLLTGCFS